MLTINSIPIIAARSWFQLMTPPTQNTKPELLRLGMPSFMSTKDNILINIGFGNTVVANRIVAIVTPGSAPMKRLREEAKSEHRLVDATQGRKTRAIIITDSNHVILSAVQPETLSQRLLGECGGRNQREG